MRYAVLLPLLAGLAAAGAALFGLGTAADGYWRDLSAWRAAARTAPGGAATRDLFDRAAAQGVIVWNRRTRSVEMRDGAALSQPLRLALDRVGEAGAAIRAELERTRRSAKVVAARARFRECDVPCERPTSWRVRLIGSGVGANADSPKSEALAAAAARSDALPAPLAGTNFALAREAGAGFVPWQVWSVEQPLELSLLAQGADRIDVLGALVSPPRGWRVERRWCRDVRGRLADCEEGEEEAAFRLALLEDEPNDGEGSVLPPFAVRPVFTVPDGRRPGRYPLSERLALSCAADGGCVPRWRSFGTAQRYSRGKTDERAASEATVPPLLAGWAEQGPDGLQASAQARDLGATALVGGKPVLPGSLLAAVDALGDDRNRTFGLDPLVQKIANDVLSSFLRGAAGGFGDIRAPEPPRGREASLVVLDLRDRGRLGLIRAAVGVPTPPEGLSRWDAAALGYDPTGGRPLGPAAWTGRAGHHIPGSGWKVATALALIDVLDDPQLDPSAREALLAAMDGLDAARADRLLGSDTLSGTEGICVPLRLERGAKGTDRPRCGAGYSDAPVRDSGRGGPLTGRRSDRYGLRAALSGSSNIWFVAALLKAEAGLPEDRRASVQEGFAQRMGFTEPQPLDGGAAFGLVPRDPASIEATSAPLDTRAIANSAFGQQVQAGPLVLAQLAAAVATNEDVRPSLFGPVPAPRPLFERGEARRLLGIVREGMRDAVTDGTARRAFQTEAPDIVRLAAGKTGTARRGAGPVPERVSTFLGWLDDRRGRPAFAIGCATTLLGRKEENGDVTVPPVCARLSAAVLARIDRDVLREANDR